MSPKRLEDKPTEVQLPITPMLDMAFQIMFFFLVNFNPSSTKEGQLDLSLPSKSEAAAKTPDQVNPTSEAHKEEIDDKAVVTISIRGAKDPGNRGEISYLTINTDNATDEEIKETKDERLRILKERLDKVRPPENKEGKKPTVRMAADSDVQWSQVMKIMDVCNKAEYQVSFSKPPDLASNP